MTTEQEHRPVLFFDGICNLCNNTVQFVIRHDKKKQFLFATLQSAAGRHAQQQVSGGNNVPDSVILLHSGKYYTRSTAALRMAKLLGGALQLLYVFIVIPSFLRDPIYDWVARNRYRWFGKRNECMIPDAELKRRFIEE